MNRHRIVSGDAQGVIHVTNTHTLKTTKTLQVNDWVLALDMRDEYVLVLLLCLSVLRLCVP